ncbi:sensor histidine kinase, partial [Sphaerisporangium rufum]|uniref:sensor histidine kinase n=1 Tax=Sphaerisporangium rufum TaxID=1381558 RepID=UPI001EF3785A
SAVELAQQRLPRLVDRLRRGEDVDPATEAPDIESAGTAEVDGVVHAFSAVQRTAVEAAVGQAALRKGVGQVFLNLAWRNQGLLQRQLALLDTMERRVEEPTILEDLFKLDHLTTRMRRHAENLVILSDATPSRRWREPVSLFDVMRSAVLEVEDYTRVIVPPMPNAPLLNGAAVADVIHLIAELVENATVFSPPETVVTIRSMVAANGFALEVEDRGLGMTDATLEQINARLVNPPEFDLVDSDRMGLFVVARLAARHGIKVSLRRSPYDGTTAIVLLPSMLLAGQGTPADGAAERLPQDPPPVRAIGALRQLSAAPEARPRTLAEMLGEPAPAPERRSDWFAAERPDPTGPIPVTPEAPGTAPAGGVPNGVPNGGVPNGAHHNGAHRNGTPQNGGPANGTYQNGAYQNDAYQDGAYQNGAIDGTVPNGGHHNGTLPYGDTGEVPAGTELTDAGDDDDLDGLPVRVRQASLAPQLRRPEPGEPRDVTARSPEELMSLMSSMQQGWRRGRDDTGRTGPV